MGAILGIDVGASTISGGLVTDEGEILTAVQAGTHERGRGTAMETLQDVVDQMVERARRRGVALGGIGIGLPGLVHVETGRMVDACNYVSELAHVPLADRLAQSTGLPVFVDNDVNALALGEWMFGAARGERSLALLALGTGVGGGLILDGALSRGHSGYAGEFGHIPIDFEGPPCPFGGRGCLHLFVSGASLAASARERIGQGVRSNLAKRAGGDPQGITAALIFDAAREGDGLARALVDRACQALGAAIGALVNALDPGLVIVTGGVAASLAPLQSEILRQTGRYALAPALERTRVLMVEADKARTVLGGAALARYELARRLDCKAALRPVDVP